MKAQELNSALLKALRRFKRCMQIAQHSLDELLGKRIKFCSQAEATKTFWCGQTKQGDIGATNR